MSFSPAEGVPPLPVMIGLHATLYPELYQDRHVLHSLRKGAVYGEQALSPFKTLISVSRGG